MNIEAGESQTSEITRLEASVLLEDGFPPEVVLYEYFEMGDKNNKGRPPPKIQGTEHKWREQKQKPKTWIKLPWTPKPKIKSGS